MFGSHYFFLEIYVILLKYPFVLKKLLYFILTTNYTMNSPTSCQRPAPFKHAYEN